MRLPAPKVKPPDPMIAPEYEPEALLIVNVFPEPPKFKLPEPVKLLIVIL